MCFIEQICMVHLVFIFFCIGVKSDKQSSCEYLPTGGGGPHGAIIRSKKSYFTLPLDSFKATPK